MSDQGGDPACWLDRVCESCGAVMDEGVEHHCPATSHTRPSGVVSVSTERNAYLTTIGRRTGQQREIEIWFATDGVTVWMLSGGGDRSDWVQNLLARPEAHVRILDIEFDVTARLPLPQDEEKQTAARLLAEKYPPYFTKAFSEGYVVAFDVM